MLFEKPKAPMLLLGVALSEWWLARYVKRLRLPVWRRVFAL